MATSIKTIKSHLTDDTIYPITKANAVYLANSTAQTVDGHLTSLETLVGNTNISSIGNGTITGAISTLNSKFVNNVIDETNSKTVTHGNSVMIQSFTLPTSGTQWLVMSYISLSASGSGTYNNSIGGRTVRSPEVNGGGSICANIYTGGTEIKQYVYTQTVDGTATGQLMAILLN